MSHPHDEIPLDADGRERPIFVTRYPKGDERLDALVAAFERGDFRRVASDAQTLLAASPNAEIRAAAEDLVRRTRPAPLIGVFLGLAFGLFLFLAIWVYTI